MDNNCSPGVSFVRDLFAFPLLVSVNVRSKTQQEPKMTKPLRRLTYLVLSFVSIIAPVVYFRTPKVEAQGTFCSDRGTFGDPVSGLPEETCNFVPTDLVEFSRGITITCRDCVGFGPNNHSGTEKGGTDSCTRFNKELVFDFSQPVADVELTVAGARRITSDAGHDVHIEPFYVFGSPLGYVRVFLPGPGISRITISDPAEFHNGPDGQSAPPGAWWMGAINNSFQLQSDYLSCNCNKPAFPRPTPQHISSKDWDGDNAPDWRMDVNISDDDGLVLNNIWLKDRYMAEQISVPYYLLQLNSVPGVQRGELKPNSNDPARTSRLVDFDHWSDDEKLVIEATYVISNIPAGSNNCLEIVQHYEFHKKRDGDKCEPSGKVECARWKPFVTYTFRGNQGDFVKLEIPQRLHFKANNMAGNSGALFRDCDIPEGCPNLDVLFDDKINPLEIEQGTSVITGGETARTWDNYHQTYNNSVDEPFWNPGCTECVHMHWRWAWWASLPLIGGGGGFGWGRPLIPPGSNQDVDIAVVNYEPPAQPNSEDDPDDYHDLFNQPDQLQGWESSLDGSTFTRVPKDLVFWYSSTGHQIHDTFSPTPGIFFNPSDPNVSAPITEESGGEDAHRSSLRSGKFGKNRRLLSLGDQPEMIVFGDLFDAGTTTFTTVNPQTLGTLPAGYSVYGNDVFAVTTEAEVAGPHVITFSLPSVPDQTTFDSLRVLHVEPDYFDPEKLRFVDQTVLSPASPAPDFANRKLSAKFNGLGTFVLASYVPQPPNPNRADLAVSITDSPDTIVANNNLTYTVTVTNNGPQTATDAMLKDSLAPDTTFVSVVTTQGTCRALDRNVLCDLGSLALSATATVTIVVTPTEQGGIFPPPQKIVRNVAAVKAFEGDLNFNNNSVVESTTVTRESNLAPSIDITNPATDTMVVGPTNLTLSATATDSDGSIAGVEFYDGETLLGNASFVSGNQYDFSWNNPSFGAHLIRAVATDNLGKKHDANPVTIRINGTATVDITSPANNSTVNRPANVTIVANASITGGGTISQVDFYADDLLLGPGTVTGTNQYSLTWNSASAGQHVLYVIATDNSSVTTTSMPVNVFLNDPPVVSVISPTPNTVYTSAPVSIPVTVDATDWQGAVRKVDFYANGNLIGTKSAPSGVNQQTFTWTNVGIGTYSITAVATDYFDAAKTSAPVSVKVNAPPTASLATPANGTQFTSPASINLTANASDSDGTISSVAFFANGTNIGSGTPAGGNQFNFTWSNVGVGTYNLTAKATDDNGVTTTTSVATVTVKWPALFVVGSTTLNSGDTAVKNRLEALGYSLTTMTGTAVTTADATGKVLVIISSTVTPTSVGTKFRTVTVPVLTWESGLFANMGMTGTGSQDSGTKTNQNQLAVVSMTHPLAAGFPGIRTITSANATTNWGKPNANAAKVATVTNDANKTLIFGYESGAVMPGLTAPARRVGLFMDDTSASILTAEGNALLDAAIQWARGQVGSPTGGTLTGSFANFTPPTLNVTTEGTVDWAHWGNGGPTIFNHKVNVTQLISNVTYIGAGEHGWFTDCPTAFSWTDGTPTASASNKTMGILTNGAVGNGLEITIPADTNLRTLKLYVGVWFTRGKLEASLSDGSAATYIDSTMDNNNGKINGVYTINYKAGSAAQVLKIKLTIVNQYNSPFGNVAWEAVTIL